MYVNFSHTFDFSGHSDRTITTQVMGETSHFEIHADRDEL